MTAKELLAELEPLGSAGYKRVMARHGVVEPFYGVKISELKKYEKRFRRDHQLALDLYATGNYDARYLAGLIADDPRMTKADLQRWVKGANCAALCSSTVAWVAAGSPHGWALAIEWIDAKAEFIQVAGWSTLQSLVSIKDDAELDEPELKRLLARVAKTIHQAPNRVRLAMNYFVISLGSYVAPLTELAIQTAEKIGPVEVDMGETDCEVADAADYIRKVQARGTIGKKRKSAKC